jgi:hypothetical protein
MTIISGLYSVKYHDICYMGWIFKVPGGHTNSSQEDVLLHLDTLLWFTGRRVALLGYIIKLH